MAVTLAESAKLELDMLRRGVVEIILDESPMMNWLPFIEVEGNAYKYNRENALATAGFFAVNGTWTESTTTFTSVTDGLVILGGDADVDNFIQRTRSSHTDQRAVQTMLKAKTVARKWEDALITGDSAVDVNSFDGLRKRFPSTANVQVVTPAAAGGSLTLSLLDQGIDLVKAGKPDILMMSRRTRRKLKALLQATNHYVESGEEFGKRVMLYDGIPVLTNDFQPDNETADNGSGSTFSSVYGVKFGEDAVAGLTNGGLEVIDLGNLESKDATRVRLRWYVGLAVHRENAVFRINGLNAA
ncbi:MAG: major capsid protein [Acidimicrobiales bacterium]